MTQKCLVCDKACDESSGWKNAKEPWVHRKCFDMEIAKTPPGESVFHCYRDPARRRSLEAWIIFIGFGTFYILEDPPKE